jgi:molybdate transport system ATP-binding protein
VVCVVSAAEEAGTEPDRGLHVSAVVERGEFRLDVEFDAAPGEVLGVLGPNGAGKSTLLRTLAGLTALTSGRISLDGEALDDVDRAVFQRADRRSVGLVFQNYRLFPHLSVRDNIAFGPRSQHVSRQVARGRADELLRRFGLDEFAARRPGALSGGQAQRVALARALATEPRLLLLDEPLAALDARTRLEVRTELRRHLAQFHGPTLLVTHDPLDAMVMTDRLLVVEGGRIVQEGAPAQVARQPRTQYVARLVGLNLYTGVQDGSRVHLTDGSTFIVAADPLPEHAPGDEVMVAVRPTAITLHLDRPERSSARNVWAGHIEGLESSADRVRIQVNATPPAMVDVTPSAVAELGLSHGAPVWLAAKATDIDVYPT